MIVFKLALLALIWSAIALLWVVVVPLALVVLIVRVGIRHEAREWGVR